MHSNQLIILIIFIAFFWSCNSNTSHESESPENTDQTQNQKTISLVISKDFQDEIDGKKVNLYILKNNSGMTASITNYGGRVVNLFVKDQLGEFIDVVLGFDKLSEYVSAKERYFGANVGRYGNRIAQGKFELDGKTYILAQNNGPNHLHGGTKGLQDVVWDANQIDDSTLELIYLSKDGEEGYPGNMTIKITYQITEDNALKVDFEANSDQKTICNLTHHSFF